MFRHFLILDGHTLGAIQVIITDEAWDKLTEEQKSILNQYANTTVNARSSTDAASSGSSIFGDHKRKKGFKKGL